MVPIRMAAGCAAAALLTTIISVAGPHAVAATRVVNVSTTAQLTAALQNAAPGDEIRMADGTYAGHFTITRSGTTSAPIVLTGSRSAVIDGQGTSSGRTVQLQADNWRLVGFTVTNGQKGIMALGAHNTIIDRVRVFRIGDEAIHFRDNSTDNVVQNSEVSDTGLREPGFGEGLYFGQAVSNWPSGQPDRSDRNKAINNKLGPNIRAEHLDLKEGTTGGEVRGNTFDGAGQSGANFADSWIDAKGNGYKITGNRGTSALLDGFQTHIQVTGWGRDNIFSGNTADVRSTGFGFTITKDGNTTAGNVVCTDNTVTNAGSGAANIPLTNCGNPGNDFAVLVDPSSATVARGSSATATVNTSVVSGSAQSVSLSTSGAPSGVSVSFNPASVTAGGSSTMTVSTTSSAAAGTATITVSGTAGSVTHTAPFNLTVTAPGSTTRFEAEDGTISQGILETTHPGFSGVGYVNCDNVSGSFNEVSVTAAAAGSATVAIRYANGTTTSRPTNVSINGTVATSVSFAPTADWDTWATRIITVTLAAGRNTVRVTGTSSNGPPNLDFYDVTG